MEKIKLTKRQAEVVGLMQDGWEFFTGLSEATNRQYFLVSKGYDKEQFNASVFSNLLSKGIIYQEMQHPFNWHLTELGESYNLNNKTGSK